MGSRNLLWPIVIGQFSISYKLGLSSAKIYPPEVYGSSISNDRVWTKLLEIF